MVTDFFKKKKQLHRETSNVIRGLVLQERIHKNSFGIPPIRHVVREGADRNAIRSKLGFLEHGDHILFVGDSITDAFRKPEEINTAFQLGAGFAMMAGAQLMAQYPEAGLRFTNRGVSGQRIDQMADSWETECLALDPDVVSILVGVNSTLGKYRDPVPPAHADLDVFAQIYDRLMLDLRRSNPAVRLVICGPFMLHCGLATPAMVDDIRHRADVVESVAESHGALYVPFQPVFNAALSSAPSEYWIYDGIHPTAAGFWLMSQTWLQAVLGGADV